jgi:FkbM family methyltransferase
MAQSLTDGRLVNSRHAHNLRWVLTQRGCDPIVETDLCGFTIKLPLSHALPIWRRQNPFYSENLGEVARLVLGPERGAMIDVGANIGDSAAIVKAYAPAMSILCIDADETYLPFLRANTARWDDVEIAAPVLLAERTGSVSGRIERARGTSRILSVRDNSMSTIRLDDLVVERSRFSAPALLKSDTDGFEARVLQGAASLLSAAGPVLFLEYHPELLRGSGTDGLEMLTSLREFGYERIAFYDKFGMLMVRCTLEDEALLRDLHTYAASNSSRGVDHYDVVVATAGHGSLIDRLSSRPAPGSAASGQ